MIYESLITTRDGEREYSKNWYCVADSLEEANRYFFDRVCEEAGEDAEFEQEGPQRKGYWDSSGETFTYIEYTSECRGMVIPNIHGNALFIDFGAENWREKYYNYKENLRTALSTLPLRRSDPEFEKLYDLDRPRDTGE